VAFLTAAWTRVFDAATGRGRMETTAARGRSRDGLIDISNLL